MGRHSGAGPGPGEGGGGAKQDGGDLGHGLAAGAAVESYLPSQASEPYMCSLGFAPAIS